VPIDPTPIVTAILAGVLTQIAKDSLPAVGRGVAAGWRLATAPFRGVIDVLLTDVELRGMDGIVLAKVITAKQPETGVLLTSGIPDYERQTEFAFLPNPSRRKVC
jgi:hypothetical protein